MVFLDQQRMMFQTMFIKPSLKDIAEEPADEMIKYMPPLTKR